MEAFSLLKYWRGGGGGVFTRDTPSNLRPTDSSEFSSYSAAAATAAATIVTTVSPSSSSSDSGDDGPFFDLEFTLPEEDDSDSEDQIKEHKENANDVKENEGEVENEEEEEVEEGEEIKFTLSSSSSSGDSKDPNVSLSPSDDLFFKGSLVPIDSSSVLLNASEALPKFPPLPVSSILKSATKFRVHMLKFNKSKSRLRQKTSESDEKQQHEDQERKQHENSSKFFTVKLKVEEVPLLSLFTRDNSSKKGTNTKSIKLNAAANNDVENTSTATDSSDSADDKKFSKDVMHKYLKKVKPLYIRVSKRYADKLRFSGNELSIPKSGAGPSPSPPPPEKSPAAKSTAAVKAGGAEGAEAVGEVAGVSNITVKSQKQGNLQAGLRVVCKHLGKSPSASSAVMTAPVVSKRRDDSLLQQQDGIQSAILHCKTSFNASRDLEASILSRSVSDPSHEKSVS